jgi:PTS system N-acetylgalactosamine-specific IIA component
MIGAVIISHGMLSDAAREVLFRISGQHTDIIAVSNSGRDLDQMERDLVAALERLKDCDSVIFFSDLHGGSCSLICQKLMRTQRNLVLMTGYNLPMLIEFAFNRHRRLQEVVPILEEKAKKGIMVVQPSDL